MMRWWMGAAGFVLVLAGAWAGWMRPSDLPAREDGLAITVDVFGQAGDGPAMIGVQPWLEPAHYQSASHLRDRLSVYLDEAAEAGAIGPGAVIVFPEHVGTWLVAAGGPRIAFETETSAAALTWRALADPVGYGLAWMGSREDDRAAAALFRSRARAMARDYQSVFSSLAAEYGVTIAAGSIVLPEPRVEGGRLIAGDGPLYNMSALLRPDGSIAPDLVRKSHPIPEETPFTAAWPADALPVFDTQAGRLAVLICADSWHPDIYAALDAQAAELVAVPAFLQPSGVWDAPWGGYTTGWPEDADRADAGRLSEAEAWRTYAMAGRAPDAGARAGMTAFLRGELWDLGSDGAAIAFAGNVRHDGAYAEGPAVTVLWLGDTPG